MKRVLRTVMTPIEKFLAMESSSGLILLSCAVAAMAVANSPWHEPYEQFLQTKIGFGLGVFEFRLSLHHWINDGLMAIFFFTVGMEIKRELKVGALASRQQAMLPIAGAIGGMVAPALIYLFFNAAGEASRGWGIPMATDIAFAVGIMSLLGKRVPLALKVFLLALAIADDLGAVLVIALFYTSGISFSALGLSALSLVVVYFLASAGRRSPWLHLPLALVGWAALYKSGVHATIAGVLLGFLMPMAPVDGNGGSSSLDRWIHRLHPWVSYGLMPLFALVNAGVHLGGNFQFSDLLTNPIANGVSYGLLLGKPIGITLASLITVKLGLARLPAGVNWLEIFGTGILGGIGFTMALFIAALALQDPAQLTFAKLGILKGSILAGLIGLGFLWFASGQPDPVPLPEEPAS